MSQLTPEDYKALNYRCYEITWTWVGQFAGVDTYYGWFRTWQHAWDYGARQAISKTRDGMVWQVDTIKESEGNCI